MNNDANSAIKKGLASWFGTGRRRALILTAVIVVGVMIVAGIVVPRLVQSSKAEVQPIVMTPDRADELTDILTERDFRCYDSELQTGELRRCFAGNDRYADPAIASVTMVTDPATNELISVTANVDGNDADDVRTEIAGAFDEAFNSADGNRLRRYFTRSVNPGAKMANKNVLLAVGGQQMRLMNGALGPVSYLPKPLPLPSQFVPKLEDRGFTCDLEYSVMCGRQLAGFEVTIQSAAAHVNQPQEIRVRMQPSKSKRNAKKARSRLSGILRDHMAGFTDADGVKFLTGSPAAGERADSFGYALTVTEADESKEKFAFTIAALTPQDQGKSFGW